MSSDTCKHLDLEYSHGNYVPGYGWEIYPGWYCLDCGEMMKGEPRRAKVLGLINGERSRQLRQYGTNEYLPLGFELPWLSPFSEAGTTEVESRFREDYGQAERDGELTWMHLIREEVSELFEAEKLEDILSEAVQVAALCVSLCEVILKVEGDRSA